MFSLARLDEDNSRGFLVSLVSVLFALPIAYGLFIGLSWRGRNLKRYLIVSLLAAVPECLILLAIAIAAQKSPEYKLAGDFLTQVLVLELIVVARCVFGFVTGGLVGDWIERRRYPERYEKSFVETFAIRFSTPSGQQVGRFERVTKTVAGLTTSMAPLIPLLGVIVTSVFGYYASREVKRKSLDDANQSVKRPAEPAPSPLPRSSP